MADNTDSERWYFTKEKIRNSPSVQDGIEHAKELGYRQQCANLIQDIGQRLQVSQLVINTAIVYMHRFYMLHSFQKFKRNTMGPCFLFLAAKIEENPRRLEHVLKATHVCLSKEEPEFDPKSDEYMRLQQELVDNESVLLQTLGFEIAVDHPNTYVVKCAQLVKASKELAQTAYFLATNSLHLTTFCIQYKPTVVACVCIYVSCLWANYMIPETESKNWYELIDNTVTKKMLEDLSAYFIKLLDSCPTRLKKRLTSGGAVVYKEGKVVAKKESGSKDGASAIAEVGKNDKNDSSKQSTSSAGSSTSSFSIKTEPNVKTHLKDLLKPQPHESTPPPSRSTGSESKIPHHHKKHHDHRSSSDSQKKMPHPTLHTQDPQASEVRSKEAPPPTTTSKTSEQAKMQQKKNLTPQQIEEYRKRKEKEKIHQQRKRDAERNEKDFTASQLTQGKAEKVDYYNRDSSARMKKHAQHTNSPLKRQKVDADHRKRTHPEPAQGEARVGTMNDEKLNSELAHVNRMKKDTMMFGMSDVEKKTSSGSGSDSSHHNPSHYKSRHTANLKHNYEQKPATAESVIPLPPPPAPPPIFGSNLNLNSSIPLMHSSSKGDVRKHSNHSNQIQYSIPPPPHPPCPPQPPHPTHSTHPKFV